VYASNVFENGLFLHRIPSHCAYTSVTHPTASPLKIQKNSPRPHSQLNSGTIVLNPSIATSTSIYQFLQSSPKIAEWTFPDQDLLSDYFKARWKPIPWYYNALRSLRNVHPQIWADNEIRCLHYIFADKPWQSRTPASGLDAGFDVMNQWWWDRFDRLGEDMLKRDPEGWQFVVSCVDTGRYD
jgi:lipopolysaccharide biosynthesis glycosyltransferase